MFPWVSELNCRRGGRRSAVHSSLRPATRSASRTRRPGSADCTVCCCRPRSVAAGADLNSPPGHHAVVPGRLTPGGGGLLWLGSQRLAKNRLALEAAQRRWGGRLGDQLAPHLAVTGPARHPPHSAPRYDCVLHSAPWKGKCCTPGPRSCMWWPTSVLLCPGRWPTCAG